MSLTEIGFIDLLALPWMLKALWSPLVDSYGSSRWGRRRSWILPLQLLLAFVCFLCSFSPPDRNLALLLGFVFSANLVAATLDIAVDGLAVDLLDEQHLGLGNTAQVVGFKVGMLIGGGLLIWASADIGWANLFRIMAALVLVGLAISVVHREPEATREVTEKAGLIWTRVKGAFFQAGAWRLLVVIATYKVGEKMADAMFGPFLIDAGYTPAQLGLWLGTWGMGCSLLGSVMGGIVAIRMRLVDALVLTAVLRVVPHGLQWWMATMGSPPENVVIGVTCAEAFFGGALTTVMFAFMMSRVDRRIGATHFTILASVEVFGKFPAAPISGWIGDNFGYVHVFALATLLSALYLLLLPLVRKDAAEKRPETF